MPTIVFKKHSYKLTINNGGKKYLCKSTINDGGKKYSCKLTINDSVRKYLYKLTIDNGGLVEKKIYMYTKFAYRTELNNI